ncbi:hypothetical protein LSH36_156g06027 [Paralvinella palmiformis]|uniref:LTD domain-containing protein n=1 Tax=Paralvinella palmiformis TaxID=53620 RepID=A0AAD9JUB3_9ANNE|nr:hypothetical protein LSH36_156g06027 [Paralvinella palmiformis]
MFTPNGKYLSVIWLWLYDAAPTYTPLDSNLRVSQVVKGEMSAKTTYQRSAKGPVSISECTADGKIVALENTGRREELLGGWKIKRIVDGQEKPEYQLPRDFTLGPGKKVKIFAGPGAGINDLTAPFNSWGIGANVTTKLLNTGNEMSKLEVFDPISTPPTNPAPLLRFSLKISELHHPVCVSSQCRLEPDAAADPAGSHLLGPDPLPGTESSCKYARGCTETHLCYLSYLIIIMLYYSPTPPPRNTSTPLELSKHG